MALAYTPYNVKFKSTQTIYQQQIICQVDENDFNYTLNPSALKADNLTYYSYPSGSFTGSFSSLPNPSGSGYMITKTGSKGDVLDFVTGSDFQPYVTTIGLYNETNELLLVAKLAQPFRMPSNTDVNFIIRYDI